jgi:hypothetical protein
VELTFLMKVRIAVVAAVGIAVIGVYAWPMIAPADPFDVVSVVNGVISVYDAMVIIALAFGVGLVSYFLAWPYGSQIGILAVPAGLAVWALRSGDVGTLMQLNAPIGRRQELFSTFCWEPLFWLGVVAAGFAGVFVASQIIHPVRSSHTPEGQSEKPKKRGIGDVLTCVVAVIGSAVVSQFLIGILARDYTIWDATGVAIAQPATGQILFAVLAAFGLVGFLAQRILNIDYVWVIIGTCLVNFIVVSTYGNNEVVASFAGRWPAVFFSNSVLTVLPIQVVTFGTFGAITGYWMAMRYDYWHKNEAGGD